MWKVGETVEGTLCPGVDTHTHTDGEGLKMKDGVGWGGWGGVGGGQGHIEKRIHIPHLFFLYSRKG